MIINKVQFGYMDSDHQKEDVDVDQDSEDIYEDDDRFVTHPVDNTGFEFRHYGSDVDLEDDLLKNNKITTEEIDMLELPDKQKREKKKFPYIQRDCGNH